MLSDELTVKILRIYQASRVVTRIEVGTMFDASRGRIAGLCKRSGISWPDVSAEIKRQRTCCFLVTGVDVPNPKFCCKPTSTADGFLCEGHVGKVWSPPN